MNARVVTLVPVDNTAISFEEAFGEYSEVRGLSQKRKQRKLNRLEVRKAKKLGRQEIKTAKQAERQKRRVSRQLTRSEKTAIRQDRRTGRQSTRAERRGARVESRLGRRQMRRDFREQPELEPQYEPQIEPQPKPYVEPETQDQGYEPQEQGYEPQYQEEPTSRDDSFYAEEQRGQGSYYGDEEGSPIDEGDTYNDRQDYYGDENSFEPQGEGEYNEDGDYVGEESAITDGTVDNFDGELSGKDGFSEALGKNTIDPQVQSTVDKLIWNAECAKRLEAKRKMNPNQAQAISQKIIAHKRRCNELKGTIDGYCECSDSVGPINPDEPKRRRMMVRKAIAISKGKVANAGRKAPIVKRAADDVIPVAADLNPSISTNRIVIPNQMKSSVTGNTGLTGIDLQDDFDAPNVREIFIGADGSKSGISLGSVVIGVAIGVAAVWAIKKYNILK